MTRRRIRRPIGGQVCIAGLLALQSASAACVSINDVEVDIERAAAAAPPLPFRTGLLRCGTVHAGPQPVLEDRTDALLAAVAAAGAFQVVQRYSEWDAIDLALEVQEQRIHHAMSKLITVFTILPPFWALWLPYRSWEEREYVVHAYDAGRLLATYRAQGTAEGWSWLIFTPDFDGGDADRPYLLQAGAALAADRARYEQMATDRSARPLDDYDHLWFIRYARERERLFQTNRVLAHDPGYTCPAYFDVPLWLPWFHATAPHDLERIHARAQILGDPPWDGRGRCTLCRREQDARFLYCEIDGMPLDYEKGNGAP